MNHLISEVVALGLFSVAVFFGLGAWTMNTVWKRRNLRQCENLRNKFIEKVFGTNWEELLRLGVFDGEAARTRILSVIHAAGLTSYTIFPGGCDDIDKMIKNGSNRLCVTILEIMRGLAVEGWNLSEIPPEFTCFYNIEEHGGVNEKTFARLEEILRLRLERYKESLSDYGIREGDLSKYRESWRQIGNTPNPSPT